MNARHLARPDRRRSGVALLITVLLLLLMGLLGFAALEGVTADRQVAGFQNQKRVARHAAEAGVSEALVALTTTGTPALAATTLSDSATYPHGRPSFAPDPNAAEPIEDMGAIPFPEMDLTIGQNGAPLFQLQLWRVRVQGQWGASTTRLEVSTGTLVGN